MPAFDEVLKEKSGQFKLIGIATDSQPDPVQFVKDRGFDWIFATDQAAAQAYRVQALPTTIFIDRNGNEVKREEGAIDRGQLEADLALIL